MLLSAALGDRLTSLQTSLRINFRANPSWIIRLITLMLVLVISGCDLPQVSAEERLFLNLSLDFLDEYQLPSTEIFENTPVRGLSALSYDRQQDRLYALSDDRSEYAPARFYSLKLMLDTTSPDQVTIHNIAIEQVTELIAEDGNPYATGSIDPEGLALSPRHSVFIASEGVAQDGIPPFIDEFDLDTGHWQRRLPIPERFVPRTLDGRPRGVQNNLGFEALTLNPGGYSASWLEPFRLFAAIEAPLRQDVGSDPTENRPIYSRFLHYLIGDELPTLISEHLYAIDPPPLGATTGLTELLTLDQGGHFLSLERSFGIGGAGAKIFQIATGGATDTSTLSSLQGDLEGIVPIRKQLLLDLRDLGVKLDNLEAMTLGPQLPDGSRSLLLVSDDNFNEDQITQFLLFRLRGAGLG
jgi:hypothetical protein